MRRILGTCCVALGLAATAFAAETPESLVAKLGSPSFADREAAGHELLKLGTAALPAVKTAAETSPDPEIRERAAALLDPLSRASDSSKLLAVKKVKLEYKAMPLASAIADFKQKTGIPLILLPGKVADAMRPVTVPAGEYAPWEGLAILLKAAGLKEDHRADFTGVNAEAPNRGQRGGRARFEYYDEGAVNMVFTPTTAPIVLMDGKAEELPNVRDGGVRITALPPGFASNRVVRGAGRVIFHLDVAPLPSTHWNNATGIRITAAEDEDGRPVFSDLKLATDPFSAYNPYDPWGGGWGRRRVFFGGGGMMWMDDSYGGGGGLSPYGNPRLLAVPIRTNDRALTKLRRFEGVVLGDVHTPNVPVVTIENIESAVGIAYTGAQQSTFSVLEYKKDAKGQTLVKIRYESLSQWAIQNMRGLGWNGNDNPGEILNRMKFYDAANKEIKNPAQDGTIYNNDGWRQSCETTLRFPKTTPVPVKLVITGTKVTSVEVPFKLANVSVP